MPIIKSAKKRMRIAAKSTVRNRKTKRNLRTAIKALKKTPSSKLLSQVQSEADRAARKGAIHKNKAARLKKRAASQAKANGVKLAKAKKTAPATAKKTTKPAAASKTTAKKTTKATTKK